MIPLMSNCEHEVMTCYYDLCVSYARVKIKEVSICNATEYNDDDFVISILRGLTSLGILSCSKRDP